MASAASSSHPMTTVSYNLPSASLDGLAVPAASGLAIRAESPLSDLPLDLSKPPSLMNGGDSDVGPAGASSSKIDLEPNDPAPMSRGKRIRAVKFR